jgi:hypothetical protein
MDEVVFSRREEKAATIPVFGKNLSGGASPDVGGRGA